MAGLALASAPGDVSPGSTPSAPDVRTPASFRHPAFAVVGYALGASAAIGAAAALQPLAGVAMLAATLGAWAILRNPAIGGLVLVGVVPAVSGLKRGLPVPGLRVSEILLAGTAAVILLSTGREQAAPWRAFDWLALAYAMLTAGLGIADLLTRHGSFSTQNVGTLFGPFQFLLIYRGVLTAVRTESVRRAALRLTLWSSVPITALALMQLVGLLGVRGLIGNITEAGPPQNIFNYYLAEGVGRATGPYSQPHLLGAFLMVEILLMTGLLLEREQQTMRRRTLIALLSFAVLGLLSTATATPIIATLGGVLVLARAHRRVARVMGALAVAAVIVWIAFGSQISGRYAQQYLQRPAGAQTSSLVPQSISYRVSIWETQYFPTLSGRWFNGYGPDLPPSVTWRFTESIYLTLVMRGGLPLLLVFIALMWTLGSGARRLRGDPSPERRVVARTLFIVVGLLWVMHAVEPYMIDTGIPHLVWALAGVLFAGTAQLRTPVMPRDERKARQATSPAVGR